MTEAVLCTCPKKGCAIHDASAPEKRYPYAAALQVAEEIVFALAPFCVRIEIAGSLRRRKPDVGDIEILYIPKTAKRPDPDDLFADPREVDLCALAICGLDAEHMIVPRLNSRGAKTYGPLNKLMRHVASGIPVDLFTATPENWFNYLVCRTGPADLSQRIAVEAKRLGWKWHPYGSGFTALDNGQESRVECEKDVFDFVGLPYTEPEARR